MDYTYILQNTILYGAMAFAVTTIFSNSKHLNFATGSFFVLFAYILNFLIQDFGNILIWGALIAAFLLFYFLDVAIVYFVPGTKKRGLFGLIFTIGISIAINNILLYIYGPTPVSINGIEGLSNMSLVFILMACFLIGFYFHHISLMGKTLKGLYEDNKVIDTLGIKIKRIKFISMFIAFSFLLVADYVVLQTSSLTPEDNSFFLLKALGIMVIVGVRKIEYIFVGALLYVLLEHILFINIGMSIAYKEPLILILILLILFIKPNGIFSFNSRKI